MSTNFKIKYKQSNGDLHVHPMGDFDGSSAWELILLIQEQYSGQGRIFIDTCGLHEICLFGCCTFQCQLHQSRLPADCLFFKGENGFKIAPDAAQVIVTHQKHRKQCKGRCKNCHCSHKNKHRKNNQFFGGIE